MTESSGRSRWMACGVPGVWASLALRLLFALPAGGEIFTFTDKYLDGAGGINGLDFIQTVTVSPDGKHVYTCAGNGNVGAPDDDNAVAVFSRSDTTGELTFVESHFDDEDTGDPGTADGLLGCRGVVVSPDGKHVYTAGFADNAVGIFSRNSTTGALTFLSAVFEGGAVDGLSGAHDLVVSSDGKHLYVAAFADDAVSAFSRDSMTGALTFVELETNGTGGVSGLDRIRSLDLSGDGKHLYTAAEDDDAVAAFSRDATTGALTFIASYAEGDVQGVNTIDGIADITDVKVSPDGQHVYTAAATNDTMGGGNGDDWIAVFERDDSTGALTWSERIAGATFGSCGLFGSDFQNFLALGPNGIRFYAAKNWAQNGIAAFERSSGSGSLGFREGVCDFDPDDLGLNLLNRMALSPLGEDLYATGVVENAVVAFSVCAAVFVVKSLIDVGLITAPVSEEACDSITAGGSGAGYVVGAAGDVTFTAPTVVLTNGFEVLGLFTVVNNCP